jgi:signal peptidase
MHFAPSQTRTLRKLAFTFLAAAFALSPLVLTSYLGFGFSPILSGSMEPYASAGDLLVTRERNPSTLKVGDFIAINNSTTETFYSHRIIDIREFNGGYRISTKGDANSDPDREPLIISPEQKVARAFADVPYIGRFLTNLNTVQGRQAAASLLVIANVLALIAFLFRKRIFATVTPERVYRELYFEERRNSLQYRELIENLQEALAIEREKEKV